MVNSDDGVLEQMYLTVEFKSSYQQTFDIHRMCRVNELIRYLESHRFVVCHISNRCWAILLDRIEDCLGNHL